MTRPPASRTPGRPAFTLVELMIVVFIIALLTGLTLTVIPRVRRAVAGTATQAQMAAIANAMEQYYGDYHAYPGPLANNQLGSAYDSNVTGTISAPHIVNPATGAAIFLVGTDGTSGGMTTYPIPGTDLGTQLAQITESENAVLGLCGGLRVTFPVSGGTPSFEYHPEDIYPDGASPNPKGAPFLGTNLSQGKRSQAYMSPKGGDLSLPQATASGLLNHGQFTDENGRHANDSVIPEFVDKYSSPLPLLILRANVGGKAIVGVRNSNGTQYVDDNGTALTNPNTSSYGQNTKPIPQWDLNQIFGYTKSAIGTAANSPSLNHNGLAGLGNANLTDTVSGGWSNNGYNAIAYLKDPNYTVTPNSGSGTPPTNAAGGQARSADKFLIISAGPDRIFGTADDQVFPGGTVSGQ